MALIQNELLLIHPQQICQFLGVLLTLVVATVIGMGAIFLALWLVVKLLDRVYIRRQLRGESKAR